MRCLSLLVCCVTILLASCHTTYLPCVIEADRAARPIQRVLRSTDFATHHTGVLVKYLDTDKLIYGQNIDHLFTPASNIKLLTYFAAIQHIDDYVPWMMVDQTSTPAYIYPLGDPGYMHPDFDVQPEITDFWNSYRASGDTVYLCLSHDLDPPYGPGWAWDDYMYGFQAPRAVMPIHGNVLCVHPYTDTPSFSPSWLDYTVDIDLAAPRATRVEAHAQGFVLPATMDRTRDLPVLYDTTFISAHLRNLGLVVEYPDDCEPRVNGEQIMGTPRDSLLSYYMKYSDNLIAEQLLRLSGVSMRLPMHTPTIIDSLMNSDFASWQEGIRWYDGSGLSRYNQLSPRAVTGIIEATITTNGIDHFCNMMPTGGGPGTIRDYYQYTPTRVWAKTGTLKHCHNLSGICLTHEGRWVVFSFMHNHILDGDLSQVKSQMSDLLDVIISTY